MELADQADRLLYICRTGNRERMVTGEVASDNVFYIIVVEAPDGFPRCSDFRYDIP